MFGRRPPPAAGEVRQTIQARQVAAAQSLEEWFEQNLAPWLDQAIRLYASGAPVGDNTCRSFGDDYRYYQVGYMYVNYLGDDIHAVEVRSALPVVGLSVINVAAYAALLRWVQGRYHGYRFAVLAGDVRCYISWNGDDGALRRMYPPAEDILIRVTPA